MGTKDIDDEVTLSRDEMLSYMMEDIQNNEYGNSIPSTDGADNYFIQEFITCQMSEDFRYISQDFLKHCYGKLEEFSKAGWYSVCDHRFFSIQGSSEKRLLRLMYNGAKLGDEYCVELLKYLYRSYHKKEYNQLKRFSKLGTQDIWNLADEGEYMDFAKLARILVMADMFNIELEESCSLVYLMLEKKCIENNAAIDHMQEGIEIPSEVLKESTAQINEWASQNVGIDGNIKMRVVKNAIKFIEDYLSYERYPADYLYDIVGDDTGVLTELALTLALLKTKHPKREYSFEDVQHYMMNLIITSAVINVNEIYAWHLDELMCMEIEEDDDYKPLFNPDNIKLKESGKSEKVEKRKYVINVAPVKVPGTSEEDYIKEISELRQKLNAKEQQNKHLREMYEESKRARVSAENLLSEYVDDRAELIALRNYAYRAEIEEESISETTIQEMQSVIADKNIVLIGGHINWTNKLKKTFPNWMYVSVDNFKTVDGKMLDGKERVYFYTDYISHTTYGKFINYLRESKIPFGYIGSQNLEKLIKQVYEDTTE